MRISAHTRMSVLTLCWHDMRRASNASKAPAHSAGDQGTAEFQGRRSADELRMVNPAITSDETRTRPRGQDVARTPRTERRQKG